MTMSENEVLSKITEGEIFGVVECDIHVPEGKKDKFSEMCPIFKNVDIPFEAIGEHMQHFVEQNGLSKKPRQGLIGSMFGMKLHGNSGYGRTLTNKEKHLDIRYCNEANIGRAVNDSHFRKLDIIDEDLYEVSKTKKSISMNLPIQIGFFVYQYAKLRMLEFYYDFIDKFIDRSYLEYCKMDTDSAYVALSCESVDNMIKPELRAEYERKNLLGFRGIIKTRLGLLTNVPRDYLRPNSRATELLGSAVKCIFASTNQKLNSAVRG